MTGADAGSLYERASDLHRRGRPEEAIPLLHELLEQEPNHVAARYAFGICLTDTGRHAEAQVQFRRVLDGDPRHYQAAYRLGRLLQADADLEGAAEAYRDVLETVKHVLGVAEFRDTATRLRVCQDSMDSATVTPPTSPVARPVTGRPITPGPPTLRAQSETHRVADRGARGAEVRLKPRHLAPGTVGRASLCTVAALPVCEFYDGFATISRAVTVAGLIFLLPTIVAWVLMLAGTAGIIAALVGPDGMFWGNNAFVDHYIELGSRCNSNCPLDGVTTSLFPVGIPAALLVMLFIGTPIALLKSHTNGADFYEYGVDVKSGIIRRKVQFIWYYQIVESPAYVRSLGAYITHTASLGLRYNEAGAYSTAYVELPGIGTPEQVRETGRNLESRIFPERYDVRKFVT